MSTTDVVVPITREAMVDAGQLPAHPQHLWHFTCEHTYRKVGKRGTLRPNRHPLMPALGPVIWLTSDPRPDRDDVGLTNLITDCDRMAYRYRLSSVDVLAWDEVRHLAPADWRDDLERYARPETWWLASSERQAVLA